MTNKAKGKIGFHYLLTEAQLCTLIILNSIYASKQNQK